MIGIVTVVKDDVTGFQRTRDSIEKQSIDDWNHIVVPAALEDSTALYSREIIDSRTTFLVQHGAGIYSAMNQGLGVCTTDYVVFLNAGDCLADPNSLKHVADALRVTSPLWAVFGGFVSRNNSLSQILPIPHPTPEQIGRGRAGLLHPSIYYQRDFLIGLGGFKEDFRIAGDLELNIRAARLAEPEVFNHPVSVFYFGGISSTRVFSATTESWQARSQALPSKTLTDIIRNFVLFIYQLSRVAIAKILIHRM